MLTDYEVKRFRLQAHGKNQMNQVAIAEVRNILPQLTQYLGKQIHTQSGMSKRFNVTMLSLQRLRSTSKWKRNCAH